jgi:hypothetical protein
VGIDRWVAVWVGELGSADRGSDQGVEFVLGQVEIEPGWFS